MSIAHDRRKRPERNRELIVIPVEDIPGVKVETKDPYYKGYSIMVKWDSRWAKVVDQQRNWYTARVWTNRTVLLEIPAYEYDLLYLGTFENVGGGTPEYLKTALEVQANDFDADSSRLTKQVLLEFPMGTELSVKVLNAAAKDGVYIEMTNTVIGNIQNNKKRYSSYATFTVAAVNETVGKRGKVDIKAGHKSKEAEMAEEMENLGI